jgi:NAD(P)-dependent dehydrogenase (short-subunit alcohol dehydrogenase family)
VVLAVRNVENGNAAASRIIGVCPRADVAVAPLDLASLQSVRTAAAELRAANPRIELLINNAGVMYTPKQTTEDGFELQLERNQCRHFDLANEVRDKI